MYQCQIWKCHLNQFQKENSTFTSGYTILTYELNFITPRVLNNTGSYETTLDRMLDVDLAFILT